MADNYRAWADRSTGVQTLEYLELAESTEKTVRELQEIGSRRQPTIWQASKRME